MYSLTLGTFYCIVFVSHVEVRFDISLIKELIDWLIHINAIVAKATLRDLNLLVRGFLVCCLSDLC